MVHLHIFSCTQSQQNSGKYSILLRYKDIKFRPISFHIHCIFVPLILYFFQRKTSSNVFNFFRIQDPIRTERERGRLGVTVQLEFMFEFELAFELADSNNG